jgi:hypothetical protein
MAFLYNKPKVYNKDDARKMSADDYVIEDMLFQRPYYEPLQNTVNFLFPESDFPESNKDDIKRLTDECAASLHPWIDKLLLHVLDSRDYKPVPGFDRMHGIEEVSDDEAEPKAMAPPAPGDGSATNRTATEAETAPPQAPAAATPTAKAADSRPNSGSRRPSASKIITPLGSRPGSSSKPGAGGRRESKSIPMPSLDEGDEGGAQSARNAVPPLNLG